MPAQRYMSRSPNDIKGKGFTVQPSVEKIAQTSAEEVHLKGDLPRDHDLVPPRHILTGQKKLCHQLMPVYLLSATWPSKQNNFCIFKLVPSRRSIRSCRTWWERVTRQPAIQLTTIDPHIGDLTHHSKRKKTNTDIFCWGEMPIACQGCMKTLEIWWKLPTRLQRQNPHPIPPISPNLDGP